MRDRPLFFGELAGKPIPINISYEMFISYRQVHLYSIEEKVAKDTFLVQSSS